MKVKNQEKVAVRITTTTSTLANTQSLPNQDITAVNTAEGIETRSKILSRGLQHRLLNNLLFI